MSETDEIRAIVQEVLLDFEGQQRWIDETPDIFLHSADTFAAKYVLHQEQADIFRYGVMIGGLYEQWRQARREAGP